MISRAYRSCSADMSACFTDAGRIADEAALVGFAWAFFMRGGLYRRLAIATTQMRDASTAATRNAWRLDANYRAICRLAWQTLNERHRAEEIDRSAGILRVE